MEKKFLVYCHTNKINSKKYIGITCKSPERRWCNGDGYKGCSKFYNAIQKYGWDGFDHIIIAEGLTKEEACQMEIDLIAKLKTQDDSYGYNIAMGGEISPTFGRRGKNNPLYGRHHSNETKLKMRESALGRTQSKEAKLKMSKAKKGEKHPHYGKERPKEVKEKISIGLSKAILQYTKDGKLVCRYKSAQEAHKQTNIPYSHICSVCLGKRKSTGGYIWFYEKDFTQDKLLHMIELNKTNRKSGYHKKKVNQYSLDKEFLAQYDSVIEASNMTNISIGCISSCCLGSTKTGQGYIWEYEVNKEEIHDA